MCQQKYWNLKSVISANVNVKCCFIWGNYVINEKQLLSLTYNFILLTSLPLGLYLMCSREKRMNDLRQRSLDWAADWVLHNVIIQMGYRNAQREVEIWDWWATLGITAVTTQYETACRVYYLMGEPLCKPCGFCICSRKIILKKKAKYEETKPILMFCTFGKAKSCLFLQLAFVFLFLLVLQSSPLESHSCTLLYSKKFLMFL